MHHDEHHEGYPEALPVRAATESASALGITLLVMVFGVLFVVVALALYYQSYKSQAMAQKSEGWETLSQDYWTMRRDAERQFTREPRLTDAAAGTVQVPLQDAMDLVIEEYSSMQASAGTREASVAERN